MIPLKRTARQLLSLGALCAALGGLGAASAAPAAAAPLVWGNAQAWVADGDITAGHSTAVSFGGDNEATATPDDLYGPLADYAEISGESHTVVDEESAQSSATVESATVRLDVDDLVDLGVIDPPPEGADPSAEPDAGLEDQLEPEPRHGTEEEGDRDRDQYWDEDAPGSGDEEITPPTQGPTDPPDGELSPEPTPSHPTEGERPGPDEEPADEGTQTLDAPDSRTVPTGNGDGSDEDGERSDEPAVEFTLADVTTTVSASFDGETEAAFEYGDLSAFGTPVDQLDTDGDGQAVKDHVRVLDDEGALVEEVPVSVRFLANETTFEDEDEDWVGEGIRASLTAWVQVGDPEDDTGFAVDFADSWAIGSIHDMADAPEQDQEGDEGAEEATGTDTRLAATGSSIAALVTAAVIAVGGGSAATFLARKRTTALDDRIED